MSKTFDDIDLERDDAVASVRDESFEERALRQLVGSEALWFELIDHPLADRLSRVELTGLSVSQDWERGRTLIGPHAGAMAIFDDTGFVEFVDPKTLAELFEAVRDGNYPLTDDMPSFGKLGAPDDTCEVWSWDDTHVAVGRCADELELVKREDG